MDNPENRSGSNNNEPTGLSVVLNIMGRLELADYGFRSWMLQDSGEPYQVVLNLFNNERDRYEKLTEGKSANCQVVINSYEKPAFFNISSANNLGIHHATGQFLMFANSDMIYPSHAVRTIRREVMDREICFAIASRSNLVTDQVKQLKPVAEYRAPGDFDSIERWPRANVWPGGSGWILRSDVVRGIGGFDQQILCREDVDITDRAKHYLARRGLQLATHGLLNLYGYHLYHTTSELFDMCAHAVRVLDARDARLVADPSSTEDVVPTNLDAHEALVDDMRRTVAPPPFARYREDVPRKIYRHVRDAFFVLIGRRLN